MIEESLVITSLSSLRILVGMLFSPTEFLILKFETILIISFSVPGDSKSESWIDGGKYSKNVLHGNGTSD